MISSVGHRNLGLTMVFFQPKNASCFPQSLVSFWYSPLSQELSHVIVITTSFLPPSLCFRFTSSPEKCPAMTCVLPPPVAQPHWPTAALSPVCASARTPPTSSSPLLWWWPCQDPSSAPSPRAPLWDPQPLQLWGMFSVQRGSPSPLAAPQDLGSSAIRVWGAFTGGPTADTSAVGAVGHAKPHAESTDEITTRSLKAWSRCRTEFVTTALCLLTTLSFALSSWDCSSLAFLIQCLSLRWKM